MQAAIMPVLSLAAIFIFSLWEKDRLKARG